MITIQANSTDVASVLFFKELKFNSAQHEDGTTEVEFIDESEGTELNQTIYDSWVAEYNARPDESYKEDRRFAYPSIQEQLDMQYHDAVNGTTTWKDAIQAVKDTYPKP